MTNESHTTEPNRRYKAIGWSSYDWEGPMSGIYTAVSPDGLRWTHTPWTIDGGRLLLNAKSDFGEIRVELLDLEDRALSGYSLADSIPVSTDGTGLEVHWKSQPNLEGAAGQTVRIRFQLTNARLYSYQRGE